MVRRSSIGTSTLDELTGYGDSAMTRAPRWAKDWISVNPNGVKPPYSL
jgi:hypothetical protein